MCITVNVLKLIIEQLIQGGLVRKMSSLPGHQDLYGMLNDLCSQAISEVEESLAVQLQQEGDTARRQCEEEVHAHLKMQGLDVESNTWEPPRRVQKLHKTQGRITMEACKLMLRRKAVQDA